MNNNQVSDFNNNSIDNFIKNSEKKIDEFICNTFNIKFDEKNNHNKHIFSNKVIDNFYYILISYNNSYEFINIITDNIKFINNNCIYYFKVCKNLINKENKLDLEKIMIEDNNKLFKNNYKVSKNLNSLFVIYILDKNKIIPVQIFEKRDIAENFRNNYFTNSFLAELKINKKYANPLQYEFLNLCQY